MKRTHVIPGFSLFNWLISLSILGLLSGCQQDDGVLLPNQDFSSLNTFDKLDIGSGFTVTVRQGTTRQLTIAVPSVDQANLRVEQTNGTLTVKINNKASSISGTVDIIMPSLTGVVFSGGIEATLSGFESSVLPLNFSGGSSATLTGTIGRLTTNLSGGSTLNTYNSPAVDAVMVLSGGSQARVAVANSLTVTASGGSELFYKGSPTLSQDLSGGSTITKE